MKKLFVILTLIVGLSNCQIVDVLEFDPMYELDLEGAITTPDMAELALKGVYSYLPGSGGLEYVYQTLSGSFMSGCLLRQQFITSGNAIYYAERYLPVLTYSSFGDGEWDSDYRIIKNVNFLLEALDNIGDDQFATGRKDEMIGECHFLVAFAYYRLMRQFAEYWDTGSSYGIIIRDELPSVSNATKKRASVADSYAEIDKHLTIALNQLEPWESSTQASVEAAKALKAQVLFLKGDYENAATAAAEAITASNPLESTYAAVFENTETSKEIIFSRGFGTTETSSNQYYMSSAFGDKGLWGPTDSYMALIAGDPREAVVTDNKNVDYTDRTGTTTTYNVNVVRKLYRSDGTSVPVIYARTAELLLIQAESLARSGKDIATAWAPIVTLRSRLAGASTAAPATQEDLMEEIFGEWLKEMAFENWHEWFAVQRFDKLFDINETLAEDLAEEEADGDPEAFKQRITWKRIYNIPTDELNANPECEANPGY